MIAVLSSSVVFGAVAGMITGTLASIGGYYRNRLERIKEREAKELSDANKMSELYIILTRLIVAATVDGFDSFQQECYVLKNSGLLDEFRRK